MKTSIYAFLVATAMVSVTATAGQAAQCADRTYVVNQLNGRFGENLAYTGLARDKHIVEVYASSQASSWTLTVATPDGLSCVLATGHGASELAGVLGQPLRLASY